MTRLLGQKVHAVLLKEALIIFVANLDRFTTASKFGRGHFIVHVVLHFETQRNTLERHIGVLSY